MAQTTLTQIEEQIRTITQTLYTLLIQTSDHQGDNTQATMKRSITSLLNQLTTLINTAPNLNVAVPAEVIDYVQEGRNPDIYTREFVELVMKLNQMHKGKTEAFGRFRDVLAREFVGAVPQMEGPVRQVVESSGGKIAD